MSYPPHFYANRVHRHYDELPDLIRMQMDGELYARAWNDHARFAEKLMEMNEANLRMQREFYDLREQADDFRITIFNLEQERDHYKRLIEHGMAPARRRHTDEQT